MKYAGMPSALWMVFANSFEKQLTIVFGYDKAAAKTITQKAKAKYQEIIADLPEFEKEDRFQMNAVSCAMLAAFILSMPKRPDVKMLTKYYAAFHAADRNQYSWNMELYEYENGSGYEARFTKCGICEIMKKYGLYDLAPALCRLDYTMSDAGGGTDFVREYTLASGGPYCDCGYHKRQG